MAVDSLKDYLLRRYDSHLGYHLFKAKFPLEDVMLFVAPLIQVLAQTRFRWASEAEMEDPKAQAFCDLWYLLSVKFKDRVYERETQFHFDCWWQVYRSFNRALHFNKQEELNMDDLDHSRLPHPQDLDRMDWISHVVEDIRVMVLEQVRFDGAGFGACEYILRALLDERRPIATVILRDYGLTHAEFYIDYVKILLRKSLYDIRANPRTYDSLLKDLMPNNLMDISLVELDERVTYYD